jgi:hypothetical protein
VSKHALFFEKKKQKTFVFCELGMVSGLILRLVARAGDYDVNGNKPETVTKCLSGLGNPPPICQIWPT